ncbi:2-oxoglutarate dehydrogenase E1 subunit family protein, partial [Nocardia testacea]|uniref:2-oxoglutarate dehydrogenase E1 subunit family protein n=1 Tax=Nocardia testacea TaxID=248551 RepID=UPI0005844831
MSSSKSQFGQNQWLVDEMYQKFKQDPSSVDASWHEFLADYTPEISGDSGNTQSVPAAATPASAVKSAPAAVPAENSSVRTRATAPTAPATTSAPAA